MPSDSFTLYISSTGSVAPPNGSVGTTQLANGSVTSDKLKQTSGSEAVITAAIRDGAVTSAKLSQVSGSEAVVTASIRDEAVTGTKLSPDAVTRDVIVDGEITESKLEANSVTSTKIAANQVLDTHLAVAGASTGITTAKLRHISGNTILGNNTSSTGAVTSISCSAAGFNLIAASDSSAQRTALGIPSGTIVDTSSAQTLSNKTLTSPTINGGSLSGISFKKIAFNTTAPDAVSSIGEVAWNDSDKTLDLKLSADVTQQVGQEVLMRVKAATTIANGEIVYISGAYNGIPTVLKANSSDDTAHKTLGVATEGIASGSYGFICLIGQVHDVDTGGISVGTELWLNGSGSFSATEPSYPNHSVRIGVVTKSDASGIIYVNPKLMSPTIVRGSFAWGSGGTTGPTVSVTGLTSSSTVVIQEEGSSPVGSFYSVVTSSGSFVPYAKVDSGNSATGALPSSGTSFKYIAFI